MPEYQEAMLNGTVFFMGAAIATRRSNRKVVLITGASRGFGRAAAEALASAGHTVYASMRHTGSYNAASVEAIARLSKDNGIDLRTIELDVQSQESVDEAVSQVIGHCGRIDVLMHGAGCSVFGPTEAFTPEQFAYLYDVNVLSTQRVNRAALPQMRRQKQGHLIWISTPSFPGAAPPYRAPYIGAKAAMDLIAAQYARELSRWGIETTLIVPGAFTGGTNHLALSGRPDDHARASEYEAGAHAGFAEQVQHSLAALEPPDYDLDTVADAIVRAVGMPSGKRPFRVHICPFQDGVLF